MTDTVRLHVECSKEGESDVRRAIEWYAGKVISENDKKLLEHVEKKRQGDRCVFRPPCNKKKLVGYRADILHFLENPTKVEPPNKRSTYQYFEDGLLVVRKGKVVEVDCYDLLREKYCDIEIVDYRGKLIIPGFIDCHIHMPQTEMIASYGEDLLGWLNRYTFPTEAQFSDKRYAENISRFFLRELLRNGTTTALVFCTRFKQSVEAFFEEAKKLHLRMIAGRVGMDRGTVFTRPAGCWWELQDNGGQKVDGDEQNPAYFFQYEGFPVPTSSIMGTKYEKLENIDANQACTEIDAAPPFLRDDSAEQFKVESQNLINRWHSFSAAPGQPGYGTRLLYAVTPRFAPTSTEEQLAACQELLDNNDRVWLHTHLNETKDERFFMKRIYAIERPAFAPVDGQFQVQNDDPFVAYRRCANQIYGVEDDGTRKVPPADCVEGQCPPNPADSPNCADFFKDPVYRDYTDVYDRWKLVRKRSLYAHCIHMFNSEWETLNEGGAGVATCPTSNFFLGSGLFDLDRAEQPGRKTKKCINVGLGTDVGAGTSFSMFDTMAGCYKAQNTRIFDQDYKPPSAYGIFAGADTGTCFGNPPAGTAPDAFKLFYMATLGGARALCLEEFLGNFLPGKEADFTVLNLSPTSLQGLRQCESGKRSELLQPPFSSFPSSGLIERTVDPFQEKLFATVILGDDRNICSTYVLGCKVFESCDETCGTFFLEKKCEDGYHGDD